MTTPEEGDDIGEVIREDAAERETLRWQLKGFIPGVEGSSKAVFKPWVVQAKDYDELRQQLADVSHERDLLRALLKRVVDSGVLSFEQDAPEDIERLEADVCAAVKPSAEVKS